MILMKPGQLPNIEVMQQWKLEEGLNYQQIADRVNEQNKALGQDYRPITRSAVSVAFHRAGVALYRNTYREEIPWKIAKAHSHSHTLEMLRVWGRLNAGDEAVPPRLLRSFENFKKSCAEYNAVITYTPELGFVAVKPRPGIDTGLIRLTDEQIRERGLEPRLAELGLSFSS